MGVIVREVATIVELVTLCVEWVGAELLGKHGGGLLVGEVDLVDGVAAVLEGDVVVVDVRREEDLWGSC